MRKRLGLATIFAVLLTAFSNLLTAGELQLVDAHIHYSHDAWEGIAPADAVKMLRKAGLRRAFVSSSSDEGTQKLYKIAPDLIVPVLRPYRKRGELSSWMHDESVMAMLSERLDRNYYAGIGEFHADGEQIDLPVLQQVIALAKRYRIFLHAHVDVEAVHRIFITDPDALVLWAHAGFESPEVIATLMEQYPNLWADLAFREEFAFQGDIEDEWLRLFERFPARFMLGTDTYTPQRWFYLAENADWARGWLSSLPVDIADNIAYRNAEALLARVRR
jgi:hypothetical protein